MNSTQLTIYEWKRKEIWAEQVRHFYKTKFDKNSNLKDKKKIKKYKYQLFWDPTIILRECWHWNLLSYTHDKKKFCQGWLWHPFFLRTNHSQAVWNSNFPPKTISQSESRRKSRQVLHVTGKFLQSSVPQKTCQHWKLTTKLDPCGGGKGGPISKLRATLNKVVFRRLSKLYLILL